MTVRAFFFVCLSAAAGVALLAALVTVATEWRQVAAAGRARQAVTAIDAALAAAEALSLEGSADDLPLMADDAADAAATDVLRRARMVSDGRLITATTRLDAAELLDADTAARAMRQI